MLRNRIPTLLLVVTLFLTACEAEFNPTSPQGSTPYVMCILNAKDSVQYVRVQRSYICQENAFNFSSNADSLYYEPDEIEVFLTRFDTLDGSIMDEIHFHPTMEIVKDTGEFSGDGHYVFKTNEQIYPSFDYELSVRFPAENKRVTARINPLGNWNFEHAFTLEERKTSYSWYAPERLDYFLPLTTNNHQQITRFLFEERGPRDTVYKYVEYLHDYDIYAEGDENLEGLDFLGDDFLFRFLRDEIEVDPAKRRVAMGVDFMIQIADSSFITYEIVGDPQGTYMYQPEYSNFRNGGVGLFASRYKFTIFGKKLKPEEIDSIALGKFTKDLNFADSKGQFHDGI